MSAAEIRSSIKDLTLPDLVAISREVETCLRERLQGGQIPQFMVLWNYVRDYLMSMDVNIDISEGRDIESSNHRRAFVYLAYNYWFKGMTYSSIGRAIGFDRASVRIMCRDVKELIEEPTYRGKVLRQCRDRILVIYEDFKTSEL